MLGRIVGGAAKRLLSPMLKMLGQIDESWGAAAETLGLRYVSMTAGGDGTIKGVLDQHRVKVERKTKSEPSRRLTQYRVSFREPLDFEIKIRRVKGTDAVGEFFLLQGIEVGDARFDRDVHVGGCSTEHATAFLTPERRYHIMQFLSLYEDARITDTGIEWTQPEIELEPLRIVETVRALVDFASQLSHSGPAEVREQKAVEQKNDVERASSAPFVDADDGASALRDMRQAKSKRSARRRKKGLLANIFWFTGRFDEPWGAAAESLGGEYVSPLTNGSGKYRGIEAFVDGHEAVIETVITPLSRGELFQTSYKVFHQSPLGLGIRIGARTHSRGWAKMIGEGITNAFGIEDVGTGFRSFDREVQIYGSNTPDVIAFLTPARRFRILRFLDAYEGAGIYDNYIKWSQSGTEVDPRRMVTTVHRLIDLSKRLTEPDSAEQRLTRALAAERVGRLDEALSILRDGVEAVGAERDLDELMLEGQLEIIAGRYALAAKAFEAALNAAVDLPDGEHAQIDRWLEMAEEGEREGGRVSARVDRGAAQPSLDVAEVAYTLFGDALDNAAVSKAFESRFAGKAVRWTGVLRSAERVSIDPVFGDEPITRAIFAVYGHDLTGFTDRGVQAIVALVPAALDQLRGRGGEELVFGGRLVACDPFGRSLYVSGGKFEGLVR